MDKDMYSMNQKMYSMNQEVYSMTQEMSAKARTKRSLMQNIFSYTSHLVGRSIQVP